MAYSILGKSYERYFPSILLSLTGNSTLRMSLAIDESSLWNIACAKQ